MNRSERRPLLFLLGFALLTVDLLVYAAALLRTPHIDPTSVEFFIYLFGGIGAAGVNALRLIVEMTFFMWAARRVLGEFGKSLRTSVVAVAPCLLAFGAAMALTTDVSRLVLLSCVLACFFTVSWRYLIPHSGKARLSRRAIESWVMSTFRLQYGKSVAPEP